VSSKINDGGSAFPQSYRVPGHSTVVGESGMSLRDWFAGQALAGIMASPLEYVRGAKETGRGHLSMGEVFVQQAYAAADKMLAAREARP
jgi:hypothetical protein